MTGIRVGSHRRVRQIYPDEYGNGVVYAGNRLSAKAGRLSLGRRRTDCGSFLRILGGHVRRGLIVPRRLQPYPPSFIGRRLPSNRASTGTYEEVFF